MSHVSIQPDLLAQAVDHFRANRFADAKNLLERIVRNEPPQSQPLLLLALSAQEVGDTRVCSAALDSLLVLEPRLVRGWLMKGDIAAGAGENKEATAFYKRALSEAKAQAPSEEIMARLQSAQTWIKDNDPAKAEKLKQELASAGVGPGTGSKRFQQSLDIIFGQKPVYVQRPNVYHFPGLPQIEFYEREEFAWAPLVEAKTAVIRAELEALLEDRGLFKPHVMADDRTPGGSHGGLAGNPAWSSLYLWREGAAVEDNARRCPATMACLEGVPLPHFSKLNPSAPSVMFSLLGAGARIPPHTGATNARLICHLPLIVPNGCGFRVGNEVREWEVGKLLIFDDTIEHEVWNESDEDRVVLIFDVWRPELTSGERDAVTSLFAALERSRRG